MDIGGITLLKSAIKNFKNVAAITDPGQYEGIIGEIGSNGEVSDETGLKLAIQASAYIVDYESRVHEILGATLRG